MSVNRTDFSGILLTFSKNAKIWTISAVSSGVLLFSSFSYHFRVSLLFVSCVCIRPFERKNTLKILGQKMRILQNWMAFWRARSLAPPSDQYSQAWACLTTETADHGKFLAELGRRLQKPLLTLISDFLKAFVPHFQKHGGLIFSEILLFCQILLGFLLFSEVDVVFLESETPKFWFEEVRWG